MTKSNFNDSPNAGKNSSSGIWGFLIPLLLAALILGILFLPSSLGDASSLLVLAGRFHPLILHFPIVIIILTAVFVLIGRHQPAFTHPTLVKVLLTLGCFTAFGSAVAGYLLFASENYTGETVQNHLYGGILTGLGICLTTAYYFYQDGKSNEAAKNPVFITLLLLTNWALAYTSHIGGSLTHGQDFLSEPLSHLLPRSTVALKPQEELLVYEDVIHTILNSKCLNCHNDNKTKGDLLMTTHDQLLKAGKSGKFALVPGNPAESEMLVRVHLPVSDDERMPPEGKPGLIEEEIKLITYWIENGAEKELPIIRLLDDASIATTLQTLLPKVQLAQQRMSLEREAFDKVVAELDKLALKLNVQIERDPEAEGSFFRLRMNFPPKRFSNAELLELEPYFAYFSSVSLASADISDDELFFIAKMANLQRLFVQKTRIDGSGLPYFHTHQKLETLNISFTPLIPGNIFHLLDIPQLKQVYIFGTPVKLDIIQALQTYRPDITFHIEEGPLFQ
ncbi:MAG: cytochrome C [Lunatimonas sp.]|uniref:c-type cytochrome domain-containing protein n=1 Tax=Lunatimonas sp. TaxID=2060141 RepID=UPI00263A3EF4|nr:c-type cytochrome domain-containing protein [Lunatimonas sp.]MCC5938579.1 cytochrome C [Lunatimonas sp.]